MAHRSPPAPLAHTFSIVARDAVSGQLGVAVQSHWFGVGAGVPWALAGWAPWPRRPPSNAVMDREVWI